MDTGTLFYIIIVSSLILTNSSAGVLKIAKFSTFGYDFGRGMNKSCAKQFFDSSNEDDCRIFAINRTDGTCGGFIDDNHEYEETEELYIQPNLFIRKFNQPRFKNFTRVGLNISIPVFKKYNQLYAIKFSIPGQDPPFRNCQVIRLKQTPKNAAIIWNDQFWFRNSDTKRNFSVKVIGLPSRKQQTFHGEVPPEKDLDTGDESNWTPVIFMQTTNDKIIITFSSVNLISEYTVELIRGKKVEQKEIVFSTGPVQKVYFTDLFEGDYVINVTGNCIQCKTGQFHFTNIIPGNASLSSISIIATVLISLVLIILLFFLIFSKHTIQPKILRKVLILQSYDCKIHEEFIFALVKALRECHFDVLIDKYRDVETSYDILHWIPEAVKQSHLVLIIWSQGALNKDNDDIKQQDPGNTVSANWNFALRQVEKKLHDFDFEVANVFWDKKINRNDIKPAFIGFQDIFLTNKLVKDWKSLLSFLYCKDFLWKRKICKFYKQDLSSFDDEGKALLEAYDNLKSYKLDLVPRERNQNPVPMNNDNFPLVELEEPQSNDSGFESGRVVNDVFEDNPVVSLPPVHLTRVTKRPPKISLEEAMRRAENPNVSSTAGSSQQVYVPYPVPVPVMMMPQIQMPFIPVENTDFSMGNPPTSRQNTNSHSLSTTNESAI